VSDVIRLQWTRLTSDDLVGRIRATEESVPVDDQAKPLILSVSGFALSDVANFFVITILYDFYLLPA
jgi:hypothetical protein